MKIHLLSGFLGSGKTTAIRQACHLLGERGIPVGVITNDQGIKLVDGHFFRQAGIPEMQVGNGCFCCNYADLDKSIDTLVDKYHPRMIFAESVGSCTDIIATVAKPLLRYRNPEALTFTTVVDARLLQMMLSDDHAFDADIKYIYFKQLEEAQIILLNKIDKVNEETVASLKNILSERYPAKTVLSQNSLLTGNSSTWLDVISQASLSSSTNSLNIDYDQYAAGEAKMGYLDQQLFIRSDARDAENSAYALIETFTQLVAESGSFIGHIKFWINDHHKLSFTSTDRFAPVNHETRDADTCSLVVNARVKTEPEALVTAMNHSIRIVKNKRPVTIEEKDTAYFKPGYPAPLHRIGN